MSRPPLAFGKPAGAARLSPARAIAPVERPANGLRPAPTVLLVDDDSAVRESLARVLATEGWRIVTASNGEQALESLAVSQPDLIITDLSMGDVSGWDLLFHENLHRPNLPVFVITALPLPSVGGADQFAAEFFQKPLNLDALILAIHRCLGTHPVR